MTPGVVRRIGKRRWITLLLVAAGVSQVGLGLPFVAPTIVLASLVLGLVAQGVKICVDSTLQESVEDEYRGRVFSVYDTLFNITFVVALLAGAFLLPPSGVSYGLLAVVGVGYLGAGLLYARIS